MSDIHPATDDQAAPDLSIVIPAYNEARRLPRSLRDIAAWVEAQPASVEVIVVDNSSTDATADVVRAFMADHPYVRLITDVPRGKGNALRRGMLEARGRRRFLCDADLSMPIDQIERFLPPARNSYDVAIASREAPGARRFGEPAYRHLMGRIYNLIVKLIALPGFEDTQCGFKMFSGPAAEDLFAELTFSGWGFDPEVLYLARKRGYRIEEIPIDWYFDPDSRVRPVHDTLQMIRDLVRIRLNDWRGVYGDGQ